MCLHITAVDFEEEKKKYIYIWPITTQVTYIYTCHIHVDIYHANKPECYPMNIYSDMPCDHCLGSSQLERAWAGNDSPVMPCVLLHCPWASSIVPLLPQYGMCTLHYGAGSMSEIQSVMRTRAGFVASGPRAKPKANGQGLRSRASINDSALVSMTDSILRR